MKFIKTFKGYEDKVRMLDADVNQWLSTNKIEMDSFHSVLSHEVDSRAKTGDLIYTVVYEADAPID